MSQSMVSVDRQPSRGELYHDTGVVLRTYRLGESDRIVVLMTERNGKVRAVAKGVRKTRSKFGSRLEPMSHVKLLMYRGRELDIINQADSVEPLSPLFNALDKTSQGLAILEAVDQLALDREANPELYKMLVGGLRTVANRHAPLTVAAFFLKLLGHEGVAPQLDRCVRCGEHDEITELVAIDFHEGGVMCRQCRSGVTVSPEALGLMRMVLGGRLSDALQLDESPTTHEVARLASAALEHHIERQLRTAAIFERA